MTQLEGDQVDQLLEAVAARLPATWPQWGGGWPYEIDAALVDAVLSIRNRYGKSPTNGVRGSVTRYRNKRAMPADDREHLERQDPVARALVTGSHADEPLPAPSLIGRSPLEEGKGSSGAWRVVLRTWRWPTRGTCRR